MNEDSNQESMLSDSSQSKYWGNISPDIRSFLDDFEGREFWTYTYNEIPSVFHEISRMIPKVSKINISESEAREIKDFVHGIIMLLASLPLRQAICCIAWLDREIQNDTDIGWGVTIYMEAASVTKNRLDHPDYSQYKLMFVRINMLLQSRISTSLFTQLIALGDRK